MEDDELFRGRFAPSPSGRMHLGNIFVALLSWLSARSRNGKWVLRIEDLDPSRSRMEYARLIEDDLSWLGLDWDEGGLEGRGMSSPSLQSLRGNYYQKAFDRLTEAGLVYRCRCRRADLLSSRAPHASDGRAIYAGTCRPAEVPPFQFSSDAPGSARLYVPDETIVFDDLVAGHAEVNLAREWGDFIVRRADGAWAYQLAVVVDDAAMGITEVARGCDLLSSAAAQIYIYNLLGCRPPRFAHVPLLCNTAGQRLSKRDASLSMEYLREQYSAAELTGLLAWLAGLQPEPAPAKAVDLIADFDWSRLPKAETITV